MTGQIDFAVPHTFISALLVVLLVPLYLFALAQFAALRGRTAIQFLLGAAITFSLWLLIVFAIPSLRPTGLIELLLGVLVLGAGLLFYLQIWGGLSRGYTLAVLITLDEADRPLDATEISKRYRGGEGLDWIMRHRLGGLLAAGLVDQSDDRIRLTGLRGVVTAHLYKASIIALGLRRTG
jgi:hypothetical protein